MYIIGINVYSDEEFEAAFRRVDKESSGFITSDCVEELLYETYGYPALEEEIKMFMDAFDTNHGGKVSLDDFKCCLTKMRECLSTKDGAAKEYTSFNAMAGDRYKHVRMEQNLEEKYKVPMTFN